MKTTCTRGYRKYHIQIRWFRSLEMDKNQAKR